jgi:hypothetical protein
MARSMTLIKREYHRVWMGGSLYMLECRDCAVVITDIEIHDKWHDAQDLIAQYIAYIRGDAPFPETQSKAEREHENSTEESKNAVDESRTTT